MHQACKGSSEEPQLADRISGSRRFSHISPMHIWTTNADRIMSSEIGGQDNVNALGGLHAPVRSCPSTLLSDNKRPLRGSSIISPDNNRGRAQGTADDFHEPPKCFGVTGSCVANSTPIPKGATSTSRPSVKTSSRGSRLRIKSWRVAVTAVLNARVMLTGPPVRMVNANRLRAIPPSWSSNSQPLGKAHCELELAIHPLEITTSNWPGFWRKDHPRSADLYKISTEMAGRPGNKTLHISE